MEQSNRNDRIQAEACRLLALPGTSARVRLVDRTTLAESGFDEVDIEEVDRLARRHALREAASDWLIGPERDVLVAPDDVDLAAGLIHVRDNALRRVKTASSRRTLPIPPELDRLGFRQLVARRQADGSTQLFPGLFGRKTAFASVFQKMWAPVLDAALPTARQQRKTTHSTRKMGNTAMHVRDVKRRYPSLQHGPMPRST